MSDTKIERLLEALREKLSSDAIPDDIAGSITLNLQCGGLSGKINVKMDV